MKSTDDDFSFTPCNNKRAAFLKTSSDSNTGKTVPSLSPHHLRNSKSQKHNSQPIVPATQNSHPKNSHPKNSNPRTHTNPYAHKSLERAKMALGMYYLGMSVLRFVQFVLAITVCGLYGVDLHNASAAGKYADSKWVYAEVVGGLAAFTAVLYLIPVIIRTPFIFIWDMLILFLWIVLFGIFGNMYIRENAEGDSGVQRMKNAVWVDLTNVILWLISTVLMAGYWWRNRTAKSVYTGRARNHV